MVTLFDYKRFKKTSVIDEITAPFYEFDTHIHTSPQPAIQSMCYFLIHRYRDIKINVGTLIGTYQDPRVICTLWDFLQNFMDISQPLPELPRFKPYRHLDPVTAEHDRKTGRNPRYWIEDGRRNLQS